MQLTFGIVTGINEIPTALTIQKGNVQDKPHMRQMLKIISKVIPQNSLLIFDTGGNTKKNRELKSHLSRYLPLPRLLLQSAFFTPNPTYTVTHYPDVVSDFDKS